MTLQVRAIAKEAWPQLQDSEGWTFMSSMPLPQRWNGSPTIVVWYLYADRMKPGLVDAVEVCHPWGYVELGPEADAKPILHMLSTQMEVLGNQGVRPMQPFGSNKTREPKPIWKILRTGVATPDLKERITQWSSLNGTIFAAIAPHHPEFVNWLNA